MANDAQERRAQHWARWLAESRYGDWLLGLASFLETLIIPIPIELVIIPYMITYPKRLWRIATITLAGCLIAAMVGYGVGYFFLDSVGRWALSLLGEQQAFATFQERFQDHGFWAVLMIGVIPVPFQAAMLVAGAAGYPVPLFLLAAGIARGVRYYGLALLVWLIGERTLALWRRHAWSVGLGLAVLLAVVLIVSRLSGG